MSISVFPPTYLSLPNPQYHHKAFGLKGSVEVSTVIKIISTVSERGIDGLAKEHWPRIRMHKLSHRHVSGYEFKSLNKQEMLCIRRSWGSHQKFHISSTLKHDFSVCVHTANHSSEPTFCF